MASTQHAISGPAIGRGVLVVKTELGEVAVSMTSDLTCESGGGERLGKVVVDRTSDSSGGLGFLW